MASAAQRPRQLPGTAVISFPWRALTSVRIAILVILVLAVASTVGMLVPQMPIAVSGNVEAEAAWLDGQTSNFGSFTAGMNRAGFFDVFHSSWFIAVLCWVVASIAACTLNRVPALMRQTFRPPQRVNDSLFERSSAQVVPSSLSADDLQSKLKRRLFRVSREDDGDSTYIFVDRFGWASLGTLATHLGLILLLAGTLVSKFDGFSETLVIAEGQSAPVFALDDDRHLIVGVDSAIGAFDETGRPLDFRSALYLVRDGQRIKDCTITVNGPCSLDGYRFHQAGFFGQGVELIVRDAETGNTLLRETLALTTSMVSPHVTVTDETGAVVYSGAVPQTDVVGDTVGAIVDAAGSGGPFWVELRSDADGLWLTVFDASLGGDGDNEQIPLGETMNVAGFNFSFDGIEAVPSLVTAGVPLPIEDLDPDDGGEVLFALENAGQSATSGEDDKSPVLHVAGLSQVTVRLVPGERVRVGDLEYEFGGQRNFAGISVRKDRGDTIIWVAGGAIVIGLALTLWFPRKRAWFRFRGGTPGRMYTTGRSRMDVSELETHE